MKNFLWHLGFYLLVNAWLFVQDVAIQGGGLDWAYWTTIPWGLGLLVHLVVVVLESRTRER